MYSGIGQPHFPVAAGTPALLPGVAPDQLAAVGAFGNHLADCVGGGIGLVNQADQLIQLLGKGQGQLILLAVGRDGAVRDWHNVWRTVLKLDHKPDLTPLLLILLLDFSPPDRLEIDQLVRGLLAVEDGHLLGAVVGVDVPPSIGKLGGVLPLVGGNPLIRGYCGRRLPPSNIDPAAAQTKQEQQDDGPPQDVFRRKEDNPIVGQHRDHADDGEKDQ